MLIIGIDLSRAMGADIIVQITTFAPSTKILAISVYPENIYGLRCFRAGANGYIYKYTDYDEIKYAIQVVSMGKRYVSNQLFWKLAKSASHKTPDSPFDKLSRREADVALLLIQSLSTVEISGVLSITPSTVSTHQSLILKRLAIKNVIQLVQVVQLQIQ